jgi:flagellar biosynthesis protein FlhB
MAEQDLDRNQAATPYKLQKAREHGQVAKSADVVSAVVFTAAMAFLSWEGWQTWRTQFRLDQAILLKAGRLELSFAVLWELINTVLRSTMTLGAPFFVTLLLAALAGNLAQTGPVLSIQPVKPDWSRVNPATGFKRVFSVRTLFFGLRALLKLGLLGAVVFFGIRALLPHFYGLAGLSPLGLVRTVFADIASLGFKIALMLWAIAVLDALYTRHEFAKQMRMSHRELKDEIKQREGDPRIRARLRELRREMLKRTLALRNTRKADVVITNPTHVAVALRYVHGQMSSPQLLAKGTGPLAAAMRRIAARHGIPVVQNPGLARKLFHDLAVDQSVPPELYAPVARILVWVFAMRDAREQRSRAGSQYRAGLRSATTAPSGSLA